MKTYADTLDDQVRAAMMCRNDAFAGTGESLGERIASGDAYFITADFGRLVTAAADQLPPDTAMQIEDWPSESGWISFESAFPLPKSFRRGPGEHDLVQAQGAHWWCQDKAVMLTPFVFDGTPDDGAGGVALTYGAPPMPWGQHYGYYLGVWFKALWLLAMQRSVGDVVEEEPPRAFRKRAERAGVRPLIRVVRLPRRVREASTQHHEVDWQSRWIVRGHWRKQPWGLERSRIRPVWIAPYVKGPEDKPLAPAAHRLFVADVLRGES